MSNIETSITIRGKEVSVMNTFLKQADLKFYAENPRIYSAIWDTDSEPSQDEIQSKLVKMDHVKELARDIKVNGGLIDPLIVRNGSFEVLEGNSRLAAYRELAKQDPIKWGQVKCTVLPEDIEDSLIFALLGQYHVKGKKDWAPYEQAGFLYRRHKHQNISVDQLCDELGMRGPEVQHLIKVYGFMVEKNENDTNKWSYYDEYLKSSKIKTLRDNYSNFDDIVVEKIKSGEISKAADVRDKLKLLADGPAKIIKKFVNGTYDFEGAVEAVEESGNASQTYKRLSRFRKWLVSEDTQSSIDSATTTETQKIKFEVEKIFRAISSIKKNME